MVNSRRNYIGVREMTSKELIEAYRTVLTDMIYSNWLNK